MTDKKQPKSRIPEFANYQEEAEFWDTHDTTDFDDEFRPVKVTVAKNLSEEVTIRLDPQTLQKVRVLAKEKGIDHAVLMRLWITERAKETQFSS